MHLVEFFAFLFDDLFRKWQILSVAHDLSLPFLREHEAEILAELGVERLFGVAVDPEEDVRIEGIGSVADVVHRERVVGGAVLCGDRQDFDGGRLPQRAAGDVGNGVRDPWRRPES